MSSSTNGNDHSTKAAAEAIRLCLIQLRDEAQEHNLELPVFLLSLAINDLAETAAASGEAIAA